MHQQLAEIVASFESAQDRLRRLSDRISEEQWSRRPAPESWSAAECVEHLNLTSRAYLPLLRTALAEARLLHATPAVYKRDALGWFMAAMIGPIRHIGKFRIGKVKTTAAFLPGARRDRAEILSDFVRMQGDLIGITRSADGLAIDRVKIVSPFGGRMQYNAYSALVILHRHEHRHLDQAEAAAK
jgi:hypothetical protein